MHMCFDEAREERMAISINDSIALFTLGRDCSAYSGDLAILHNDVGRWVNILSIEEADVLKDCSHREIFSRQSRRPEGRFNLPSCTVASKVCGHSTPGNLASDSANCRSA